MARTDRLFRLLQAMRMLPPPVTAARLADETGMSVRSLYRDIDSLRAAGARIEGERGYGYRLIEDNSLRPQAFDRIEIEAIALGLAEVRHAGDPDLARAAASVLAKVSATLPDDRERYLFHAVSQVYRMERRYPEVSGMAVIRAACWAEDALSIAYRDQQEAETLRTVWPWRRLSGSASGDAGMVLPASGVSQIPYRPHRPGDADGREFPPPTGRSAA